MPPDILRITIELIIDARRSIINIERLRGNRLESHGKVVLLLKDHPRSGNRAGGFLVVSEILSPSINVRMRTARASSGGLRVDTLASSLEVLGGKFVSKIIRFEID